MSNIFDALNKRHGASKEVPLLEPLTPRDARESLLPTVSEVARDRELESLRQRIFLEIGSSRTATLTFAGAVTGEGSSTLALLFARELAQWEQRPVLLVDGDLGGFPRTLTGALQSDGLGLTDLLDGKASLTDAVLATEQPHLHFLPRGGDPLATLDGVSVERLQGILREVGRHYAFTILDSSPLLLAPEGGALAASTDGVVLVVRAHRTRREIVQKAIRLLNQSRCRVLGVVLNARRYPIPSFIYSRL